MRNASGPWTGSWTRLHWPKRSETICWERALHTLRTRRAYSDMSSHILTIRYDGVLAAPREMDGADSKAVIGGAQIDCSRLRGESQSLRPGVQQSASDQSDRAARASSPDGCMNE